MISISSGKRLAKTNIYILQPTQGSNAFESESKKEHEHGATDLYRFICDVDHAGAELDADREVMDRLEALVGELQEQAGFAHP